MKKLMTTIMITSTLLMASNMTKADDRPYKDRPMNPPSVEHVLDRMANRLDLTEEQKQNIKPVIEEEMQKMQALRQERQQKIESYLTEEQKQKLASRKDRKKDGKQDCRKSDDR